nr:MAG TPA: hypothetical protein [Inoviridae sp.]
MVLPGTHSILSANAIPTLDLGWRMRMLSTCEKNS